MIYLYIDKNSLKILATKKTLLSQQEVKFFKKKFEVQLIENGKVTSVDILASAIKEAQTSLELTQDKEIFLILPQGSFQFLSADVPGDIAESAIKSFAYDKAQSKLGINLENYLSDYYVRETGGKKHISFYSLSHEILEKYLETLQLLNLKLVSILPETLAIFKLFEKTLRSEKQENILYANYESDYISGYVFNSQGLVDPKRWSATPSKDKPAKKLFKEKVTECEKDGIKLNRLVLSGTESEAIRQDTFTKDVGVWTNPLKRIIPNFYEDYLKQLVLPTKEPLPILALDVCFGAFVFATENREFQLLKKPIKAGKNPTISVPRFSFSKKDIGIFLLSLVLSFSVLVAIFRFSDIKNFASGLLPSENKPTPTATPKQKPTPTATPKAEVNKEKVRVLVLNGVGTPGLAGKVRDLLSEAGFEQIITDNAENYDYKKTVVQLKDEARGAQEDIEEALADFVNKPTIETLDEEETADIVIIIGADFE